MYPSGWPLTKAGKPMNGAQIRRSIVSASRFSEDMQVLFEENRDGWHSVLGLNQQPDEVLYSLWKAYRLPGAGVQRINDLVSLPL